MLDRSHPQAVGNPCSPAKESLHRNSQCESQAKNLRIPHQTVPGLDARQHCAVDIDAEQLQLRCECLLRERNASVVPQLPDHQPNNVLGLPLPARRLSLSHTLTLTVKITSLVLYSHKMNADRRRGDSGEKPPLASQKRLEKFIAAKQVIVFAADIQDKEFPYITCSMWGAIPTNELFVRLSNGAVSFVACVPSPLEVPAMGDRIFGMDVADANAAGALADKMWARHKHQLIHSA